MTKSHDISAVETFIAQTCRIFPEPVEQFAPVLEQIGTDPDALVSAGTLLYRFHYLACEDACYARALLLSPDHPNAAWNRVRVLTDLRRIGEVIPILSDLIKRYGLATRELVDYFCNQALWVGKHRFVAEFIAGNVEFFVRAALSETDSHVAGGLLTYASEVDPILYKALSDLYQLSTGKPSPSIGQSFNSQGPSVNDFIYASHCFAGTNAFINFLLLIGVRVDEIGRWWDSSYQLTETTEIRTYIEQPKDELPARIIRRFFPLQKKVRCYSFSHRLPNPDLCAGRASLFLIRDPRVSIVTQVKPSVFQIESGAFARFVAMQARDWCEYVDGIEKISTRLVVRFEDWKADPIKTGRALIEYFKLSVRNSELEEAIFFSGTELARQLRSVQGEIFGTPSTHPVKNQDSLASNELMAMEYSLIEEICGSRLAKYGY